jgi:hypothetical protein
MQGFPRSMGVSETLVVTCGRFYVLPHDDAGVRASDEVETVKIRLHALK